MLPAGEQRLRPLPVHTHARRCGGFGDPPRSRSCHGRIPACSAHAFDSQTTCFPFQRVNNCLQTNLHTFILHSPEWTPVAIDNTDGMISVNFTTFVLNTKWIADLAR